MAEQNDRMLKVIRPGADRIGVEFSRLREYRELLFFLVWRDLKVRYKQTALGVTWAVLQPLATMVVFSIVFGRLAKIPSDGVPYPIFAYCALVPWQMFSYALTESSNSMVQNQYLISKIYFPRLIVPLTPVFTATVDFLLAFAMLIAMMLVYGVVPKVDDSAVACSFLCWSCSPPLPLASGCRRSLRSIVTSATRFRSSFSSGCLQPPSRIRAVSCRKSGGCSTD